MNCQDCRALPAELVGAAQQGQPSGPWLPSLVRVAGLRIEQNESPQHCARGGFRSVGRGTWGWGSRPADLRQCANWSGVPRSLAVQSRRLCAATRASGRRYRSPRDRSALSSQASTAGGPAASVFGFAASRTPHKQRPTAATRHEPNPRLALPSLRAQCVKGISKRERNDVKRCAGGVQERLSRRLVDTGRRARPAGPCLFGRAGRRPISGRRSTCGARCRKEGARDGHGKAGDGDLAQ